MESDESPPKTAAPLRQRAEEMARQSNALAGPGCGAPLPAEIAQTLHKLRVHQIELEMQNEELRRTQAELQAARARYFDLYDLAPVGYLRLNEAGLIIEANLSAVGLFGVQQRGELIKRSLSHFILEEDQDLYYRQRRQLLGAEMLPAFELRLKKADGTIFWAQLSASLLRDAEDNPFCHLALSDISERKRAEAEVVRLNCELEQRVASRTAALEAANKEMEAFTYSVSHDLRAPLRIIAEFSLILQQDYAPQFDAEGQRILATLRGSIHKMDQMITGLLSLSRISRSELNAGSLDMTGLARAAYLELASPEVLETFTFNLSALPRTQGDPLLIHQVWASLIANAIKFSLPKAGRRIDIGGAEQDGVCTYWIADQGVGFDPQYAHKLFTLFERLHPTGLFEGNGVGLAVVQRILQRHGGQVWGEGQVDAGARFTFTLPARMPDA